MARHPLSRRQALGLIGSLGAGFACGSSWAGQVVLQTPPRVLYERLHSFDEKTDPSIGGARPTAGLIQASDGLIYGTCQWSGPNGGGTVYRLVAGEIETVHAFGYVFPDGPIGGQEPRGRLLEVSPGVVWGTTRLGGAFGDGTVFRLSLADAVHEVVCSFDSNTTGRWPAEGVILASDGNFYGSTSLGGVSDGGTLFRLRPDGTLENLYSFKKNGSSPVSPAGGLMQASDGFIYGSARGGGAANAGVIYRLSLDGRLTIVHEFNRSDGATPETRGDGRRILLGHHPARRHRKRRHGFPHDARWPHHHLAPLRQVQRHRRLPGRQPVAGQRWPLLWRHAGQLQPDQRRGVPDDSPGQSDGLVQLRRRHPARKQPARAARRRAARHRAQRR
jgi:uncharacterized repeat protein (TIGR03803 family)